MWILFLVKLLVSVLLAASTIGLNISYAEQPAAGLKCLANKTRLILTSDVQSSVADEGTFIDVLFLTPCSSLLDYFFANNVPNNGILTFKTTFLFLGLTTKGDKGYTYVSEFSMQAVSSDKNYPNYTNTFSVDSSQETYFSFEPPVITDKIVFTVTNTEVELGNDIYYWNIKLFGCEEVNVIIDDDMAAQSLSCPILTSAVTMLQTVSVDELAAPSETQTRPILIPASPISSTSIQSSLPSATVSEVNGCADRKSILIHSTSMVALLMDSSQSGTVIAGAVVPLLIIIIIMLVIIGFLSFWIHMHRPRNCLSSGRTRTDTLKELTNAPALYSMNDNSVIMSSSQHHQLKVKNGLHSYSFEEQQLVLGSQNDMKDNKPRNNIAEYSTIDDHNVNSKNDHEEDEYIEVENECSDDIPSYDIHSNPTSSNKYECVHIISVNEPGSTSLTPPPRPARLTKKPLVEADSMPYSLNPVFSTN